MAVWKDHSPRAPLFQVVSSEETEYECTTWPRLPVPRDCLGAKWARAGRELEGVPACLTTEVRAGSKMARPFGVIFRPPPSPQKLLHRKVFRPLIEKRFRLLRHRPVGNPADSLGRAVLEKRHLTQG